MLTFANQLLHRYHNRSERFEINTIRFTLKNKKDIFNRKKKIC